MAPMVPLPAVFCTVRAKPLEERWMVVPPFRVLGPVTAVRDAAVMAPVAVRVLASCAGEGG